jgi:hypothetical protein
MKNFSLLGMSFLFMGLMNTSCDVPQGGMYEDQKEYIENQQPKHVPPEKDTAFIERDN